MATCRLTEELVQTAHGDKINDLSFPNDLSEVFATCGLAQIRIWHLRTCRELLRISVPNLECHCVTFTQVLTDYCTSLGLMCAYF
jgi:WD40 repeat protein